MPRDLNCGEVYTRVEINAKLGGSLRRYLPTVDKKVVCGCFRMDTNPEAPRIILVGNEDLTRKSAQWLADDGSREIPVFMWRRGKQWELIGHYRATGYSEDPAIMAKHNLLGRSDLAGVLFLEPCAGTSDCERR